MGENTAEYMKNTFKENKLLFLVLLSTPTANSIADRPSWIHLSHSRKVSELLAGDCAADDS